MHRLSTSIVGSFAFLCKPLFVSSLFTKMTFLGSTLESAVRWIRSCCSCIYRSMRPTRRRDKDLSISSGIVLPVVVRRGVCLPHPRRIFSRGCAGAQSLAPLKRVGFAISWLGFGGEDSVAGERGTKEIRYHTNAICWVEILQTNARCKDYRRSGLGTLTADGRQTEATPLARCEEARD